EVALLQRVLAPGDVFVDVGANIGYFTAVAAASVGRAGEVHAFEPVPRYFERLDALRRSNPEHRLHVYAEALGDAEGSAEIRVTRERNIGWKTLLPGLMRAEETGHTHTVRVRCLDHYLAERGVGRVALIKIDVEGYELPVLRGLTGYFE